MNMITSASCSMLPLSRISDMTGRLSARCSTWRLSWERARIGTFSSLANALRLREISDEFLGPIFLCGQNPRMSWR